MKKNYEKPEVEYVLLNFSDAIMTNDEDDNIPGGSEGGDEGGEW